MAAVLIPALTAATGAPAASAGRQRVLVFDIQATDVPAPDLAAFPDLLTQLPQRIGDAVTAHEGYEVIPLAEVRQAVHARKAGCVASESCRWRIAHELHAQLTLFGSVVKREHGYTLFLTRTDVTEKDPPRGNSQDMKKFRSLPLNATLCLNHLFGWHDTPGALPDASPAVAPTASPPAPPAAAKPEPGAEKGPASHLVLVAEAARDGLDPDAVAGLPRMIASLLSARSGLVVVGNAEMHKALQARETTHPHCRESEACLASIGRQLHAEIVIGSTFRKVGQTFQLELRFIDPTGARHLRSAAETMRKRESLARNVALCVDKLFPKEEAAPAVIGEAPSKQVDIGTATGAKAPIAQAPATALPIVAKPVAGPPAPDVPTLAVLVRTGNGFEADFASQARAAFVAALQSAGRFHILSDAALDAALGLDPAAGDAAVDAPAASYLGFVDISRAGGHALVLLKLLDVKKSIVVARAQEPVTSTEELPGAADRLLADVLPQLGPAGVAAAAHHDAAGAFDEARQADRDGLPSSELYRGALATDATDARAALQLALQLRFEDAEDARLQYQVAVEHRERLSPAGVALLDAADPYLRDPPDWDEVERRLAEASRKFPSDAGLLQFLGTARSNLGRAADALATFEQAAKLDAEEPGIFLDLAQAAFRLHRIDDALAGVNRCLLVSPFAGSCARLRITLLEAKGEWAEVEREARRLVAADPTVPESYSALVQAQVAQGVPLATIAATLTRRLQFVAGDREHQQHWDSASLALFAGDFTAAESHDVILWEDGRGKPALYALMDPASALFALYRELKRPEDSVNLAEKTAEAAAAMTGNDQDWGPVGTQWTLTYERYRAGKATKNELESARNTFLNAPSTSPDKDRLRRWRWLQVYGKRVQSRDEAEEALTGLPELLKDPSWNESDPGEECPVGRVFAYAGRTSQAILLLESCLRSRSGFWDVLDVQQYRLDLARAYESAGRKDEARTTAQKIVDRWNDPKSPSRTVAAARELLARIDGTAR
jgi:tetratricopeptide (TPR) repeat protein